MLRRSLWRRYITSAHAESLTKLLYAEHYTPKEASETAVKGSVNMKGWYAARTELNWLREWVESTVDRDQPETRLKKLNFAVLQRVDLHKPLSYIIGWQPFLDCTIKCVEPQLIPRPETEQWVFWLRKKIASDVESQPFRVLDLCCGSGCIGVALAKQHTNVSVVSVDVQDGAVELTKENFQRNGIADDRYRVVKGDMFSALPPADRGLFDLIVANPPYIFLEAFQSLPRTVSKWESKLCLVGDAKHERHPLSYYQELCRESPNWLKPNRQGSRPSIVMEVGEQAHEVGLLFDTSDSLGWCNVEVHQDWNGELRWCAASWKGA